VNWVKRAVARQRQDWGRKAFGKKRQTNNRVYPSKNPRAHHLLQREKNDQKFLHLPSTDLCETTGKVCHLLLVHMEKLY